MSEIIDPAPVGADIQRLKPNAVGLVGVLFMAVATAAPITAMVGNVPISVGFGNGAYAPAGYFVATIVLTLFATAALIGGSLYQFSDRIFTEFPALVRR